MPSNIVGWIVQAEARRLPLAAARLDGVLCECALSLLPEPAVALCDFWRILRPGGWLVLSDVYARVPLERARDFVARNWAAPEPSPRPLGPSFGEWDVVLERARTHALCLSGMAFQDAWTLDLDRLRECHIHIADAGGACIPFCAYNLTDRSGRSLYRPSVVLAAPSA